jgi:hypothetical protein
MLDHSAQSGRAALTVRKDDLYETPRVAVETLLRIEKLPHHIWEPACGPGAIVSVLREHGHAVWATDLVDYECPCSESGIDFLMERQLHASIEAIVTNPPFKLATEFVEHALLICPRVVMLLRLAFLESTRRGPIMDGGYLARVYPFANRLPMMHRDGWEGPRASSATPFCWFVWDRDHKGPTELKRISWE